jgi:LmbE family N-acetylglucosaminyl deacetylase
VSTVLAVSPHLDDAVLSAAGLLRGYAEAGNTVTVVTLFAGIPDRPYSAIAVDLHELWGLPHDPVEHRREEDRRAHELLGTRAVHAEFLDELYRRAADGEWLIGDDWQRSKNMGGDELGLRRQLATYVHELLVTMTPEVVVTCAAVGRHIDHRRTRDAVLAAAAASGVPLRFWEDEPYAEWTPECPPLPPWATLEPPGITVLDERGWALKFAAVKCYQSQYRMLWPESVETGTELRRHAAEVASESGVNGLGERCWDVTLDPPASAGPGGGGRLWLAPGTDVLPPSLYAPVLRPEASRVSRLTGRQRRGPEDAIRPS